MLVYAFSATGATVHLHYCCGKLQHLAMQEETENPDDDDCPLCLKHHENQKHADCSGMESCDIDQQSHNHCQNVKVDAQKTTGEHLPGSDKNPVKIYPLELLVFTLVRFIDLPLDVRHTAHATEVPSLTGAIPLFVQYCTYRI